jgi:hypothetical protein
MSDRFLIRKRDLANMQEIARVRGPGERTWTELAIYYRGGHARPFVAVVEGLSVEAHHVQNFRTMSAGTVDRAFNWFDPSNLRDALAEKLQAIDLTSFKANAAAQPRDRHIDARRRARGWDTAPAGYKGPDRLTDVLPWLYEGAWDGAVQTPTERWYGLAFERDFGVSERTVRNTLAIEAGRAGGKIGPWVAPFIAAMRYFDRNHWRCTAPTLRNRANG